MAHVSIEWIVGRKNPDVVLFEFVSKFEGRSSHGDSQGFGLIASGNHTTVVIGKNNHCLALVLRLKNPFARSVKIIAIN
jgi:hypothetical protein|tara:strand:- start:333 stop:569 length:237 start_codon:yes stop_codon:yes gene_type:complete